uniref:C-type lectin domain-containing protein n=1 Tax=Laticauda laticaudata TaxID=8630 RepID=A0A8C5SPU3_LATLA
ISLHLVVIGILKPPFPEIAMPSFCSIVACPDSWIKYNGKCLYVSKEERNWPLSLETCSSFNASLAVIDTQKELEFLVDIFHSSHYWFGLSRKVNQIWKWSNGTVFKNQFPVRGEGLCAYLNGKGANSTVCSMEKHFLCSRPESYIKAGMKGSSCLGEIWRGGQSNKAIE